MRKQVSYATISVTHSGTSIGRLAQRERRCLTSTRSQVQILYRPPLKSQVRHFLSDLFFFQGNQGKQVPDKLATIGHASLPPKRRAHKNGRRLAPTPENQRAFALKARLSNTGTDAPSVLWTRDAPVPGRESALRATSPIPSRKLKKAAGSADGPQAIRFPCGDPENPERIRRDLQGRRTAPYSPCAPFTAPSISRAWASDASVASPESIRAISAGRSSADNCRRQVWGIPSSPAILVTA